MFLFLTSSIENDAHTCALYWTHFAFHLRCSYRWNNNMKRSFYISSVENSNFNPSIPLPASVLSVRVVNRKIRSQGHVEFPGKLIDGSLDLPLLTSALCDHQMDVLVIQDADEVALGVAVVQGDVVRLKNVSESRGTESRTRGRWHWVGVRSVYIHLHLYN